MGAEDRDLQPAAQDIEPQVARRPGQCARRCGRIGSGHGQGSPAGPRRRRLDAVSPRIAGRLRAAVAKGLANSDRDGGWRVRAEPHQAVGRPQGCRGAGRDPEGTAAHRPAAARLDAHVPQARAPRSWMAGRSTGWSRASCACASASWRSARRHWDDGTALRRAGAGPRRWCRSRHGR